MRVHIERERRRKGLEGRGTKKEESKKANAKKEGVVRVHAEREREGRA